MAEDRDDIIGHLEAMISGNFRESQRDRAIDELMHAAIRYGNHVAMIFLIVIEFINRFPSPQLALLQHPGLLELAQYL